MSVREMLPISSEPLFPVVEDMSDELFQLIKQFDRPSEDIGAFYDDLAPAMETAATEADFASLRRERANIGIEVHKFIGNSEHNAYEQFNQWLVRVKDLTGVSYVTITGSNFTEDLKPRVRKNGRTGLFHKLVESEVFAPDSLARLGDAPKQHSCTYYCNLEAHSIAEDRREKKRHEIRTCSAMVKLVAWSSGRKKDSTFAICNHVGVHNHSVDGTQAKGLLADDSMKMKIPWHASDVALVNNWVKEVGDSFVVDYSPPTTILDTFQLILASEQTKSLSSQWIPKTQTLLLDSSYNVTKYKGMTLTTLMVLQSPVSNDALGPPGSVRQSKISFIPIAFMLHMKENSQSYLHFLQQCVPADLRSRVKNFVCDHECFPLHKAALAVFPQVQVLSCQWFLKKSLQRKVLAIKESGKRDALWGATALWLHLRNQNSDDGWKELVPFVNNQDSMGEYVRYLRDTVKLKWMEFPQCVHAESYHNLLQHVLLDRKSVEIDTFLSILRKHVCGYYELRERKPTRSIGLVSAPRIMYLQKNSDMGAPVSYASPMDEQVSPSSMRKDKGGVVHVLPHDTVTLSSGGEKVVDDHWIAIAKEMASLNEINADKRKILEHAAQVEQSQDERNKRKKKL